MFEEFGEGGRTRTAGHLLKRQMLYRLSYTPKRVPVSNSYEATQPIETGFLSRSQNISTDRHVKDYLTV
jgi:hypothetical protein